jgi:hypothetical protein
MGYAEIALWNTVMFEIWLTAKSSQNGRLRHGEADGCNQRDGFPTTRQQLRHGPLPKDAVGPNLQSKIHSPKGVILQ